QTTQSQPAPGASPGCGPALARVADTYHSDAPVGDATASDGTSPALITRAHATCACKGAPSSPRRAYAACAAHRLRRVARPCEKLASVKYKRNIYPFERCRSAWFTAYTYGDA